VIILYADHIGGWGGNDGGVSAHHVHHTHPNGITKFSAIMLNQDTDAYIRFRHIKRTFLGPPFTRCNKVGPDGTSGYSEHQCMEIKLLQQLCKECQCYPSYAHTMEILLHVVDTPTCRKWFTIAYDQYAFLPKPIQSILRYSFLLI